MASLTIPIITVLKRKHIFGAIERKLKHKGCLKYTKMETNIFKIIFIIKYNVLFSVYIVKLSIRRNSIGPDEHTAKLNTKFRKFLSLFLKMISYKTKFDVIQYKT